MKKRILSLLLALCMAVSLAPASVLAVETEAIYKDIPIVINLDGALGLDINIRLDPKYVEDVQIIEKAEAIQRAVPEQKLIGNTLKLAFASQQPMTNEGALFTLRLKLKAEPGPEDELYSLLQVKVDEKITWQATSRVILRGVKDNGAYTGNVTPDFSEGVATLNGDPFEPLTEITEEGQYLLEIIDETGRIREVRFAIDRTAPIITIEPYDLNPTVMPLTVKATVNEGTLEQDSFTFLENGSFTFVATDAAGNQSEKTVTVDNIYGNFTMNLVNVPEQVIALQGFPVEPSGWMLECLYDDMISISILVTRDMLQADTSELGAASGLVIYQGNTCPFDFEVVSLKGASIAVTKLPTKTRYEMNEQVDPSGMELTVTLADGTTMVVPVEDYTLSQPDTSEIGPKDVTVTFGELTAVFQITVKSPTPDSITSDVYTIDENGFLLGIAPGTTLEAILATIPEADYIIVLKGDQEPAMTALAGTGMTLHLMDGDMVLQTVTLVVTGDTNGDGRVTVTDLLGVKSHILGKSILSDAAALAGDIKADGKITITDVIQLKAIILGKNAD